MKNEHRTEMQELAEQFYEWMEFTNYSPETIIKRRTYLGFFFDWCEERNLERVADISRPVIERYQKHLFHKKKKDRRRFFPGSYLTVPLSRLR